MNYAPTIGLEIHAELNTKTKMFCNSKNDPDEKRPNVNICPVCLAHPGTLPVINKEAVKSILKVGLSIGGELADFTEFDRKNYFYPDIPKGYQISQYKYPLVSGGSLNGVSIERVHLEEDTARSSHEDAKESLVDFNRAGVPLMELVTKPVIKSSEEAVAFAKELQLLLQYLGVSEANMEKGEMRVEANVSVKKLKAESRKLKGDGIVLGTKVEVKNLNSFRVVGKAIEYEIKRQIDVLEGGGQVVQETRGFNENTQETFSQRLKESSHDYRYFPDPDLPKLYIKDIPEFSEENLKKEIPELPAEKRERFKREYGIKDEDIEMYIIDRELGARLEARAQKLSGEVRPASAESSGEAKEKIKILSNYMTSFEVKLREELKEKNKMTDDNFIEVIKMLGTGELSSLAGKEVLAESARSGDSPRDIAEAKKLLQKNDLEDIEKLAREIISENEKIVKEIISGKDGGMQYLIGQGMKKTGGAINPKLLTDSIKNILSKK